MSLLILLLLYSALGTARDAVIVLLNLPFALVGGVVAAVAFGMTLSVSAAVAFIVLLGVAVQNGVVLVAYFAQLRRRGISTPCTPAASAERKHAPKLWGS